MAKNYSITFGTNILEKEKLLNNFQKSKSENK